MRIYRISFRNGKTYVCRIKKILLIAENITAVKQICDAILDGENGLSGYFMYKIELIAIASSIHCVGAFDPIE